MERARSTHVDIWRDRIKVVATPNDQTHTDELARKGGGAYTYKVCEAGTFTCSDDVVLTF